MLKVKEFLVLYLFLIILLFYLFFFINILELNSTKLHFLKVQDLK